MVPLGTAAWSAWSRSSAVARTCPPFSLKPAHASEMSFNPLPLESLRSHQPCLWSGHDSTGRLCCQARSLPSVVHSVARHHYRTTYISTPLSCPIPLPPGPYIIPLSSDEYSALLPAAGTGGQILHCLGGPEDWLRRLAISLVGSVLLCNLSVLATATASLYWVWGPLATAARGNVQLRLQYKYAGIWRARVLAIREVRMKPRLNTTKRPPWQRLSLQPRDRLLRVVVGDSLTSIQLYLPLTDHRPFLRTGEPAEVLVLSDRRGMPRFRAVRDVFLPEQGLWVAEYPAVERAVFEDISTTLEPPDASSSDYDEDPERRYSGWFNEEDVRSRHYDHAHDFQSGDGRNDHTEGSWETGGMEAFVIGEETEWSAIAPDGGFDFYQDERFRES